MTSDNPNRLINIITLSHRQSISIWIIADSHQILSQPKYNAIFKKFTRTLFLSPADFNTINTEDQKSLYKFFKTVKTYDIE